MAFAEARCFPHRLPDEIGRYLDVYNARHPHTARKGKTPDHAYFTRLPSAVPSRFAGQFGRYHATLERGDAPPVTLDDARRSLELATALFHSAETGQGVDLPIRPDHPKYADWRPQPKAVA